MVIEDQSQIRVDITLDDIYKAFGKKRSIM